MDVLSAYVLRGPDNDNDVVATLRSAIEIRPRSAYDSVEVLIDGHLVGVLTKLQSEKFLPLVRYVERCGKVPVVRATVKGTQLKAGVVLHTVTAETVDDDWLDALGPETTTARMDSHQPPARPDFEWDDESETDQRRTRSN